MNDGERTGLSRDQSLFIIPIESELNQNGGSASL